MRKREIYLGTSGWLYSDWDNVFYPLNLSNHKKLSYYAKYFNSVEINSSFYHFINPKTYQKWYQETPENFGFSLKVNRSITHFKRLKNSFKNFLNFFNPSQEYLKEKLKILLFQFPKSFVFNKINFDNLYNFILKVRNKTQIPFAFEFRHISWENKKVQNFFKKYNICFVWSDSSVYPKFNIITNDFLYLRFHGPKELFASCYSLKELKEVSRTVKKDYPDFDFFIYFNNDISGYAILNAKQLKNLLLK